MLIQVQRICKHLLQIVESKQNTFQTYVNMNTWISNNKVMKIQYRKYYKILGQAIEEAK
jgi:hypothetical protein